MSDEHMSDKDMDAVLRKWTQEAPAGQPDRSRVVGTVVRRLGSTRRRRDRWWAFPWRNRKPVEPDKPATQPSPIPASNGHTPTVTGRTTSMLSPVKAITAGAIVFAVSGAFLIAQPFGQPTNVPGAATDMAGFEPAKVTGTLMTSEGTATHSDVVDGLARSEWDETGRLEMSDERLSGDWEGTLGFDRYFLSDEPEDFFDGPADIFSGTVSVENDSGTWTGTLVGLAGPREDASIELVGAGGYEGLSALLFHGEGDGWYGVITPGGLGSGE